MSVCYIHMCTFPPSLRQALQLDSYWGKILQCFLWWLRILSMAFEIFIIILFKKLNTTFMVLNCSMSTMAWLNFCCYWTACVMPNLLSVEGDGHGCRRPSSNWEIMHPNFSYLVDNCLSAVFKMFPLWHRSWAQCLSFIMRCFVSPSPIIQALDWHYYRGSETIVEVGWFPSLTMAYGINGRRPRQKLVLAYYSFTYVHVFSIFYILIN